MEHAERVRKGFCLKDFSSADARLSFIPLPKSANHGRIESNTELYDFELSDEDVTRLDGLDKGKEGAVTWNPVDVP
jgi:diketogulonate reductase-like aldo/keto reductase